MPHVPKVFPKKQKHQPVALDNPVLENVGVTRLYLAGKMSHMLKAVHDKLKTLQWQCLMTREQCFVSCTGNKLLIVNLLRLQELHSVRTPYQRLQHVDSQQNNPQQQID